MGFFEALGLIYPVLRINRYMSRHADYCMREFRIIAYTQFMASYSSVKMETMASAFGVSVPFLDKELSRFISVGRVNAKIDKVGGIVVTNRPDSKNAQYQSVVKHGDVLLN